MIAYAAYGIVLLVAATFIMGLIVAAGRAERRREDMEREEQEAEEERRNFWREELLEGRNGVDYQRRRVLHGLAEIRKSARERIQ